MYRNTVVFHWFLLQMNNEHYSVNALIVTYSLRNCFLGKSKEINQLDTTCFLNRYGETNWQYGAIPQLYLLLR